MSTLFEQNILRPLADRLRPRNIADVVGQDNILAENAPLGRMLSSGKLTSFILWGPPGCGKTTIARLLAENTDMIFIPLSAVFSGVADLRKVFTEAEQRRKIGKGTLLFVDEIHRFNRSQQDAFLPYLEDGTVVLVGATTENPSFELNAALLSRCKVFVLNRLDNDALEMIIKRAEATLGKPLPVDEDARTAIKAMADGDGRYLINMLEAIFATDINKILTVDQIHEVITRRPANYDKDRDGHYNLISALHKSLRGSDPDAALYWCERMIEGGEDPTYILRRLTRFAVEDVGLADPNALTQAIAAWDAYERLGSPEGDLAIAQLVIFLATAPKSIAVYKAHNMAKKIAKETGSLMPPMHILNAPTKMMKELGYSDGYIYDPDTEDGFSGQNYFPKEMNRITFYRPFERGFEREIKKRLIYWNKLRIEKQEKKS